MTTKQRIVVFGGTGFLGRRVVTSLADAGHEVIVATRHPAADTRRSVVSVAADVTNAPSVERAVQLATAAVNCVALYVEKDGLSFEDVHVKGARNVAKAASANRLSHLVHLSGIGSDTQSSSPYAKTRGRGEEVVRQVFSPATIFRPSVMFGPGDAFLSGIAGIVEKTPVYPLFGFGRTNLQPVYVEDVANAARNAISVAESRGRIYELGGPEVLSYRAIVERVMELSGKRRILLPFPFFGWKVIATASTMLPTPPITEGQISLMKSDNTVARGTLGIADLGVIPRSMVDVAPRYIGSVDN